MYEVFLRKVIIKFLRDPIPAETAETNYYFPATTGPRLTHPQKTTGTVKRQKKYINYRVRKQSMK